MTDTFEYPPSLASHYPVDLEAAGVVPAIYQLGHHFFISRFKTVMLRIFDKSCTRDSVIGLQYELVQYIPSFSVASF